MTIRTWEDMQAANRQARRRDRDMLWRDLSAMGLCFLLICGVMYGLLMM